MRASRALFLPLVVLILFCGASSALGQVGQSKGAVLPLLDQANDPQAEGWLGYVVAECANRALNAMRGSLRAPEAQELAGAAAQTKRALSLVDSQETARALCLAAGLDYVLFGSYRTNNGNVIVDFEIYDNAADKIVVRQSAQGTESDVAALGILLARRLAETVVPAVAVTRTVTRQATPSTSSAEALRKLGAALYHADRARAARGAGDNAVYYEELRTATNRVVAAIDADPNFSWAYEHLGMMSTEILALDPNNAAALNNLGLAHLHSGDYGAAISSLRQAVQKDPANAEYRVNLANALVDAAYLFQDQREANLQEAVRLLEEALATDPQHIAAQNNLGAVLYEMGKYQEAAAAYEKAAALAPQNPYPRLGLGLCYLKLQQPERARIELNKAIELDPEGVGVLARAKLPRG